MKKILISLLLLNIFNSTVCAETASIALAYNVQPAYIVTIPDTVDITNTNTSFNFYVSGDIYYDCLLNVTFDGQTSINDGSSDIDVYVQQDKTQFSYNDLLNNASGTVTLTHNVLKAGDYTGNLNLVISLEEGE